MAILSLTSLLVKETKTAIYEKAIALATTLGVPTTAWEPGDPTRSLYHLASEILSTLEEVVAAFIAAGFLDYATGDWLTILAQQVFNVTRSEATYATTTVTLTNGGGGLYTINAGDLQFRNSATGKTYRNTTGGTLASGPGTTLSVTVVADEAGSASSAVATEIDALVTTLLGVTCSNATSAVGLDAQSDASLRQACRDKWGSLSPNGPKDAYNYVAKRSALTGTTGITRSRTIADSATGAITVYLAGPSGAISEPDRALAEAAILKWATPLGMTPTVLSATNVTVAITYQLWLYTSVGKTSAEVQTAVAQALAAMFQERPIGGDVISSPPGALFHSMIESVIRGVYPAHAFRVSLSSPSGDTSLTIGQVAALGSITPTVTFVTDP